MLLSQLSLRHSLEIRELQSATFKTVVIAKESSYVSEAQEATRSFTEKAKAARDNRNTKTLEDLGEPQYHSCGAMVKVAVNDAQAAPSDVAVNDAQAAPSDVAILESHFKSVASVSDLVDKVFIAKVKRCFDKRMSKVHFAVSGDMQEVLDALLRTMQKAGGKIKHGTAPRSGNERELQELVDQLAKIVGDA
eukprot:s3728_g2.t1